MDRFLAYQKNKVHGKLELDNLSFIISTSLLTKKMLKKRVEPEEEFRPDLISFRVYNNYEYWWAVLMFNDIVDPWEELIKGRVIRLPQLEDIQIILTNYRNSNRST